MQSAQHPSPPQPLVGEPYRTASAPADAVARRGAPRGAPFRVPELVVLLAIVLACDVAFYDGGAAEPAAGGLGLAVFFAALPAALLGAAWATRRARVSRRLVVVAALLVTVAARCAFAPTFGTALVGFALLLAFALTLRGRRLFVPELAGSALAGIVKLPSRVGAAGRGIARLVARTRVGRVSPLPIVVPFGLCVVFVGVFALANPVVAHAVGVAWSALASLVNVALFGRAALWLFAAIAATALLRPSHRLGSGAEAAVTDGDASVTGILVARNTLVGLNALFLVYNALDAVYLWTGTPPSGMPTQTYAHEGALWLTIALVLLTSVIGVLFRGALAHDPRALLSRKLAVAWMVQGLVLALGTYRRIAIHIGHSGLSDLRVVGILGTTLVVIGVVLVALKLRERRTFRWLLRRQLDAFAMIVALYTVFPTHLVSARFNVARIERGEYRPLLHMFRQSTQPESAAALLPLLHHPDVRVRQGVAALLEKELSVLAHAEEHAASWREHDVASDRAWRALADASPTIDAVLGGVDRREARAALFDASE